MSAPTFAELDPARYPLPDEVLAEAISPALVVWEEHVRSNVARVIELLDGEVGRWRPHLKTAKLPRVWRLVLEQGVRRVKCATTRELDQALATARGLGLGEFEALYAMVPVGPAVARLAQLAASYPEYRVAALAERRETVHRLPDGIEVFCDVDLGLGRTGTPLAERDAILDVVRAARGRFAGVHAYDGHRHEPDLEERTRLLALDYAALEDLVAAVEADGHAVREVVTAGTPALIPAAAHRGLHRPPGTNHTLSPGTVVLHDVRSEEDTPELGLTPAALVLTRVLSRPAPDVATLDAGSKALSVDAGGSPAVLLGRPGWRAGGSSEEHLPVTVDDDPRPGDVALAIPRHVCTTVAQHDEALWIDRSGRASVLRVSARGHELYPPVPTRFA